MDEKKSLEMFMQLKAQRDIMESFYNYQSAENLLEQNLLRWDNIHDNLADLLEQVKMHNFKAQQLQQSGLSSEKEMVNLNKILKLVYACLVDCSKMTRCAGNDHERVAPSNPSLGEQLIKVKQQIDIMSLEMTKTQKVKETLENVYCNHKMDLADATSSQENEEQNT